MELQLQLKLQLQLQYQRLCLQQPSVPSQRVGIREYQRDKSQRSKRQCYFPRLY